MPETLTAPITNAIRRVMHTDPQSRLDAAMVEVGRLQESLAEIKLDLAARTDVSRFSDYVKRMPRTVSARTDVRIRARLDRRADRARSRARASETAAIRKTAVRCRR